jgi:hypothetical protein
MAKHLGKFPSNITTAHVHVQLNCIYNNAQYCNHCHIKWAENLAKFSNEKILTLSKQATIAVASDVAATACGWEGILMEFELK